MPGMFRIPDPPKIKQSLILSLYETRQTLELRTGLRWSIVWREGERMPDLRHRPVCPICHRPMTLELQPSGLPPRTFQCLECERPDPMKSPVIAGILNALQPPK